MIVLIHALCLHKVADTIFWHWLVAVADWLLSKPHGSAKRADLPSVFARQWLSAGVWLMCMLATRQCIIQASGVAWCWCVVLIVMLMSRCTVGLVAQDIATKNTTRSGNVLLPCFDEPCEDRPSLSSLEGTTNQERDEVLMFLHHSVGNNNRGTNRYDRENGSNVGGKQQRRRQHKQRRRQKQLLQKQQQQQQYLEKKGFKHRGRWYMRTPREERLLLKQAKEQRQRLSGGVSRLREKFKTKENVRHGGYNSDHADLIYDSVKSLIGIKSNIKSYFSDPPDNDAPYYQSAPSKFSPGSRATSNALLPSGSGASGGLHQDRVPMPVPQPQLHPPEYYSNGHVLHDFTSTLSGHRQMKLPRLGPEGGREAYVSLTVTVMDQRGQYVQTQKYTVEGTYSPLGSVQAAEGIFRQVKRQASRRVHRLRSLLFSHYSLQM